MEAANYVDKVRSGVHELRKTKLRLPIMRIDCGRGRLSWERESNGLLVLPSDLESGDCFPRGSVFGHWGCGGGVSFP